MIGRLFGWLGRKAVLYVLLVVAIAASTFIVPVIKQLAIGKSPMQMREHVLRTAASEIAAESDAAERLFGEKARALRLESVDKLDDQRRRLINERAQLVGSIGAAKSAWVLAIADPNMLLTIERSKLRVAVIDQELSVISTAREAVASNGASIAATADLTAQQDEVGRLVPLCNQAKRIVTSYEQRWR